MRVLLLVTCLALCVGRPLRAGAVSPEDSTLSASQSSSSVSSAGVVYDGRAGQVRVKPPRLEETGSATDGNLGEPQW
jgi:hypothetical protein